MMTVCAWAATIGAQEDPYAPALPLDDLLKNRTFAQGLVELVAQESPGDLGDAMKALGKKAGPEIAKYKETWGGDVEVYQQTMAPRPKSEPELTALRNALELAAIDARSLEIPVENIFKSEGGRAAFASYVKDLIGQAEVPTERRDQFKKELNKGTPLELKPILYSRVELGETYAKQALDGGDLDAFKQVLGSSERAQSVGAMREVMSRLNDGDGSDFTKAAGQAALDEANDWGNQSYIAKLEAALG